MSAHVTALCQSGFFQLRQWRPFTRSLTTKAAKTLVQAFISCRLDYCNSLLYRVTDNVMRETSRCIMLQHASSREPDVVTTAATGVQTRLFGAPGIVRSNAYLPGWWYPSRLQSQRRSLLRSSSDNMCAVLRSTYAQQLGRQKLWRCSVDPRIWNSLPRSLRTLDINYIHFKTLLKTYMFRIGHGALWHSI